MMERKRSSIGGFTLLEVVVAMAILGLGLVAIMELFSSGLRLARLSEDYSKAVSLARTKMEEVRIADQLAEGEEQGEFDKYYRWKVGVKKVEMFAAEQKEFQTLVELYQIQVSVIWGAGPGERSAIFETYRLMKPKEDAQKS